MPRDVIEEIRKDVYIIYGQNRGSHVYVVRGGLKNVLIDTGLKGNFSNVEMGLKKIGMKTYDIDVVLCTHEHFDHIGALSYFSQTALTAAHRFAATKVELQDEYVMHSMVHGEDSVLTHFHLWLENRMLFDIGDYKLKILHTPGHTSGCICIMEPFERFMFTGDTVFSGGTISKISDSGSYGDYINSLERLITFRIDVIYPGHGSICEDPYESIRKAVETARKRLFEYKEELTSRSKSCDWFPDTDE